ncbi:MAG: DNA translocase FtsK [Luteolibacter sp.]
MAYKDNKKRGELPEPGRWSNEINGIILIAAGLMLLLAFISYSPADLPKWGIFEAFADKSGEPGGNFLGLAGGLLAFVLIVLFGAAGCLVPVALIFFGIVKMTRNQRLWPRFWLGFAAMVISAATWLHAVNFFFIDWTQQCKINSPGGVSGTLFGGMLLMNILARPGTVILSSAVYLVSLIYLTGQEPVGFTRSCYHLIRRKLREWRERQAENQQASAREALVAAERERQREQRRIEREAAKSTSGTAISPKKTAAISLPSAEEKGEPQAMLPLREIPAPKIIDGSQRRITDDHVPGAKPFERKKSSGHQSLSVTGYEDYELPGFDLLDEPETSDAPEANHEELIATQRVIIETLKAFNIEVTAGDITRGPTITRYEIYPPIGLRVSRISQLEADLARATCAERINILAPIPGKDTVGIELANSSKVAVPLRELLHDPEFSSAKKKIPLALGKDVYGKTVIGDLAAMPHLLVAGATGSGKSVCINSIIASMLFKFGPDELRFIMVDPKVVEMQMYNKLPHLVVPVVTDPKKTVAALKWVVNEMEKRYRIFAKEGVRNFDSFNNRPRKEKPVPVAKSAPEPEEEIPFAETVAPTAEVAGEESSVPASHQAPPWAVDDLPDEQMDDIAAALASGELGPEADEDDPEFEPDEDQIPDRFPYIVVLIDELADLMQTAPADVEMCIARIAQKARAAGIHLIIATQTPRADVVTGIIKANIPSRIAFQVSSALDSRVILDTKGAEKLVGKGDMLYLPPGSAKLERSQGAFVTDAEVERIIAHCSAHGEPRFETDIQASLDNDDDEEEELSDADEELIIKCIEVAKQEQKCSTSLLQRRLRLGYTRAARMVDILEARGIIGPGDGAKPREVYVK